jgi:hypothetical protein
VLPKVVRIDHYQRLMLDALKSGDYKSVMIDLATLKELQAENFRWIWSTM